MIVENNSKLLVSDSNRDYFYAPIKDVTNDMFLITCIDMNQFDVAPIDSIDIKQANNNTTLIKFSFKDNLEIQRDIIVLPYQKFLTYVYNKNTKEFKTKFIPANMINLSTNVISDNNRINKVINKEFFKTDDLFLFNLKMKYNNNFSCNGIMVETNY